MRKSQVLGRLFDFGFGIADVGWGKKAKAEEEWFLVLGSWFLVGLGLGYWVCF